MTEILGDSHLLITGVTGKRTVYGGKTAVATWHFDTWGPKKDLAIFYNAKGDDGPDSYADSTADTVAGVASAINQGERHISLNPSSHDWQAVHDRLGDLIRNLPTGWEKVVYHDESPEYDDDTLQWFLRVAGNGENCQSVVIAQSPNDVSQTVRKQCCTAWVGPITDKERGVFRAMRREAHLDWIQENHEPYQWTVLTGPAPDDRLTFKPVPEKYA